jgi:hypothetical protein
VEVLAFTRLHFHSESDLLNAKLHPKKNWDQEAALAFYDPCHTGNHPIY